MQMPSPSREAPQSGQWTCSLTDILPKFTYSFSRCQAEESNPLINSLARKIIRKKNACMSQESEGAFPATAWSRLLQVHGPPEASRNAWEQLARSYWQPLYVFLRRRGLDHHSAADDIQGFFAYLLN